MPFQPPPIPGKLPNMFAIPSSLLKAPEPRPETPVQNVSTQAPNTLFAKPSHWMPMASRFWDGIVAQDQTQPHSPMEWIVLTLACHWLSEAETQLMEGKFINAGISTDKFMQIASKFGFTPVDREKAGFVAPKPKPAPRRKRSADELTPAQITAKLTQSGVIETRVIPGMEEEPENGATD